MSKLKIALQGASSRQAVEAGEVNVFSTYTYTGNNATQIIENGVDLAADGGMVWIKNRSTTSDHVISDTEIGTSTYLRPNIDSGEQTNPAGTNITSFNSNGFTLSNSDDKTNNASSNYVSWTFKKTPKFFDIVNYTGDGTADRRIPHSLGCQPGLVILKSVSATGQWVVRAYPTELQSYNPNSYYNSELNQTFQFSGLKGLKQESMTLWGQDIGLDHRPGSGIVSNTLGEEYTLYIFAEGSEGGFGEQANQRIIKCGTYTGNGTAGLEVTTGFEPEFVLIKSISTQGPWSIFDNIRGMEVGSSSDPLISTNGNIGDQLQTNESVSPTATGFIVGAGGNTNNNQTTYMYMAIRRAPKTPTTGTEVFKTIEQNWSTGILDAGFPVDLAIFRQTDGGNDGRFVDRLRGKTQVLKPNATSPEGGESYYALDNNKGFELVSSPLSNNWVWWLFKRAPGFFDVITWTGTGQSGRTLSHNLNAPPTLWLTKSRQSGSFDEWWIGTTVYGSNATLDLNLPSDEAAQYNNSVWNNTLPTYDELYLGNYNFTNTNNIDYVGYLFGDIVGVSKVGTYTGTGGTINVDCGFATGARFVLIKRADSIGDWYVWDSVRGIVAGNDPYLFLNTTAAEVTTTDYIDPLAIGFTVTSSAPAALNASGGTYIFLAIA